MFFFFNLSTKIDFCCCCCLYWTIHYNLIQVPLSIGHTSNPLCRRDQSKHPDFEAHFQEVGKAQIFKPKKGLQNFCNKCYHWIVSQMLHQNADTGLCIRLFSPSHMEHGTMSNPVKCMSTVFTLFVLRFDAKANISPPQKFQCSHGFKVASLQPYVRSASFTFDLEARYSYECDYRCTHISRQYEDSYTAAYKGVLYRLYCAKPTKRPFPSILLLFLVMNGKRGNPEDIKTFNIRDETSTLRIMRDTVHWKLAHKDTVQLQPDGFFMKKCLFSPWVSSHIHMNRQLSSASCNWLISQRYITVVANHRSKNLQGQELLSKSSNQTASRVLKPT